MAKLLYLFVFSLLFFACVPKNEQITGTWEFVSTRTGDGITELSDKESYSIMTISGNGNFLIMDEGVLLSENKNDKLIYTGGNEGSIYYGKWKLTDNDSTLQLQVTNFTLKDTPTFTVSFNDGKNLILHKHNVPHAISNKYAKKDYNDPANTSYNYMSNALNQWRNKETKKLSEKELQTKLNSAIGYALEYFKYHRENNTAAMIYFLKPLPLQFAPNGIAFNYEHFNWDELFYDLEDAEKANEMLLKAFRQTAEIPKKLYKKPIEINIFILNEVLQNLNS